MTARCVRLLLLFSLALGYALSTTIQQLPCGEFKTFAQLEEAGSCTSGEFTYKNFSFQVGEGSVPLSSSQINVGFSQNPSALGVRFSSSGFAVTGEQASNYFLSYLIDPPPVIIRGFEEDMETFTPVAPGTADIFTRLCAGGTFDGEGCFGDQFAGLSLFHHGTGEPQTHDSVIFEKPTNIVDVQHHISLNANGASADFSALSNGILLNDVPEPATLGLIGAGLAMLSLLRHRARKS